MPDLKRCLREVTESVIVAFVQRKCIQTIKLTPSLVDAICSVEEPAQKEAYIDYKYIAEVLLKDQ